MSIQLAQKIQGIGSSLEDFECEMRDLAERSTELATRADEGLRALLADSEGIELSKLEQQLIFYLRGRLMSGLGREDQDLQTGEPALHGEKSLEDLSTSRLEQHIAEFLRSLPETDQIALLRGLVVRQTSGTQHEELVSAAVSLLAQRSRGRAFE